MLAFVSMRSCAPVLLVGPKRFSDLLRGLFRAGKKPVSA